MRRPPRGLGHVVWVACLLTAAMPPVTAQPPLAIDAAVDRSVEIPPAQTHHLGREIAQTMHYTGAPWLVRESRQREED
ncbi:MAG: hypothetical protein ACKOTB_07520, partial [Planctomycetia bacterium]